MVIANDVPSVADEPETILALGDDLLRRYCFRCHPDYRGDGYPAVVHGLGCAACHLSFYEGKLQSHQFSKPNDRNCLSCHYGNWVGADYYGRYDHDLNWEYRTPFTTTDDYFRPYGLETHPLQADIHQQRGLVCQDCHKGNALMGLEPSESQPSIRCENCHLADRLALELPPGVERVPTASQLYRFIDINGTSHPLPLAKDRAHQLGNSLGEKIACQSCHATWGFNDSEKHFLRQDHEDFDEWWGLPVQGSLEVERIVANNTDFNLDEIEPEMIDKLTGEPHDGIWLLGYRTRRWEKVILGRSVDGTITPMRPLLDFHLSWVDDDNVVRFNSVALTPPSPYTDGYYPYVPHTTGKAGLFAAQRIETFLRQERGSQPFAQINTNE